MRPDGNDWIGVELRGIYDGLSVYAFPDGRIINRWNTDDWKGSSRWARTQDYIDHNRDYLIGLAREQLASAGTADVDHQEGDADLGGGR